jgi:Ulp1 family protease
LDIHTSPCSKKTIFYIDSLSATKNGEFVAGKLNEFIESENNTKQSSSNDIRRKGFVKWDIKQIQCPIQLDGDNCRVFTIMNMVRTSQNIRENRYLNSSNLFTNPNITSANLNKGRQIIKEIIF